MGFWILSILGVAAAFAIDYYFIEKPLPYGVEKTPGVLSLLAVLYLFPTTIFIHALYDLNPVEVLDYEEEVVALSDGQGIHGSFGGGFLFMSGNINSQMEYNFYVKSEKGGYILRTVPAQLTRIIEKEGGPYTVTKYSTQKQRKESIWFFAREGRKRPKEWVFIIPPGSVVRKFKLDME